MEQENGQDEEDDDAWLYAAKGMIDDEPEEPEGVDEGNLPTPFKLSDGRP